MFADGQLLTQLIPIFVTFKNLKMFWKFGDFIDLDPDPDLDWSNFVDLDPDTINPDPHHWLKVHRAVIQVG